MQISPISDIVLAISRGEFVIMVDRHDRENEGDLILAAEYTTGPLINFLLKEARGLICLALTTQQVNRLELPLMQPVPDLQGHQAAFTVSIDARENITTGVSARERALTILKAIKPETRPQDLQIPGHIFPIVARDGGVLVREGHTEAAVDLAQLAGLIPAAITCEILDEDGESARAEFLSAFARKHQIKIGRIDDLITFRKQQAGHS